MIKKYIFNGIKDFNLVHIFECGQSFRWNPEIDLNGNLSESYIGVAGSYAAKCTFESKTETLEILASGGDENFWRNYFDLDTNYGEIKRTLLGTDLKISTAIAEGYGIRILNQDIFETIVSFIISQNNNIPRIKKLIEALCEKYGEPIRGSEELGENAELRYAFPTAEKLAEAKAEDLAEMKFGYRAQYIPAAAKHFLDEGEPQSYEDLINYLGVGPKVANCIQLFGLHRVDAFPIDTWVKHIMNDMYGFEESDLRGMANFARERFGNFAGYAQQYLFFYYRG